MRDHVIGRHDDQHRIRIAAGRPQGRQRQRRRGIASERLENDRGPLAEQANLFGNDEAMLFIANDQRLKKSGNPVNTSHRRLQHGLLADQRQQLLGIFFTRDRPQAGT